MPQFVMEGALQAGRELDAFTLGYVEALLFTCTADARWCCTAVSDEPDRWQEELEQGVSGGELPNDCGYADFSPAALEAIKKDCEDFQRQNHWALAAAEHATGYGLQRAGNDFWYTRNGHGTGYWDRPELPEKACTLLSEAARYWSELYPWWNVETSRIEL